MLPNSNPRSEKLKGFVFSFRAVHLLSVIFFCAGLCPHSTSSCSALRVLAKCLELIQSLMLHSKMYMREHSKIFVCHFRNASGSILSLLKTVGLKSHYQPLSISPDVTTESVHRGANAWVALVKVSDKSSSARLTVGWWWCWQWSSGAGAVSLSC